MKTAKPKRLEFPARPQRRKTSYGKPYRWWCCGKFAIHKFADSPFVAFQHYCYTDTPTGEFVHGFRPIGERRTLRAAIKLCQVVDRKAVSNA